MVASIIALGETAKQWDGTGFSIGVNDSWRYGRETDILLTVNKWGQYKSHFDIVHHFEHLISTANNPQKRNKLREQYTKALEAWDRQKWVVQSTPKHGLYSQLKFWEYHHSYKRLIIQPFKTGIEEGIIYHSNNSPFIAASLAYYLGYKEIVLWGVDMVDHRNLKNSNLKRAVNDMVRFNEQLKRHGAELFLGVSYGVLKDKLKVYEKV